MARSRGIRLGLGLRVACDMSDSRASPMQATGMGRQQVTAGQ